MNVVIPNKQDTAFLRDDDAALDPAPCEMDYAEGFINCAQTDFETLSWRARVYINDSKSFRFRLKSWVTPNGARTICLRVRRKREDGSLGMERLVYKRVNGRVIK